MDTSIGESMDTYLGGNICCACLSTDRKLKSVSKIKNIHLCIEVFFNIVDELCWECEAKLNKIGEFKKQLHYAKEQMQSTRQYEMLDSKLKSFSNLCCSTKNTYDSELIHDFIEKEEPPDFLEYDDIPDNDESIDTKSMTNYETDLAVIDVKPEPVDIKNKHLTLDNSKHKSNKYDIVVMDEAQMLKARDADKLVTWYKNCENRCESCIVGYNNKEAYSKHMVSKHSEGVGKYICNICEVRYTSKDELSIHLQAHYLLYKCKLCETSSHHIKVLLAHYSNVHEVRQFVCKFCNKEFRTFRTKRYHMESVHKEKSKCNECGRLFSNKSNLKRHHEIVHTPNTPIVECPVCRKKYRGQWRLKSHMKFHLTNNVGENAYCAECNMQFKNVILYKSHLKKNSRHISPENALKIRKYVCPDCDKRFAQRIYLRRHIDSVHLNKKEHVCHICCKMYVREYSLRHHIKVVHEGGNIPKNFVCDICQKAFADKMVLKQHINSHTGARPYACQHCSATFGFASARYMHTKLIHLKHKRNDKNIATIDCAF